MDAEEIESRVQRLNMLISEGRIARNAWSGTDEQGRETACLLAALSPEAGDAENADFCPAAVMPLWFAHLTPWLDDASSDAAWPQVIRRYAACANLWHALDEAAWCRVEIATRRAAVIEAMRHTTDEQVLAACRGVLAWLDADMPEEARAAVKAEARAARPARLSGRAAQVAMEAASASDEAASTASTAMVWAARAAAQAAAAAAAAETAMATKAAAAKAAAETATAAAGEAAAWAREAAKAAAADRIADAILTALEQECLAVR